MREVVQNGTIIYTLGSFGVRDFVENWLIGLKKVSAVKKSTSRSKSWLLSGQSAQTSAMHAASCQRFRRKA